MPGIRREGDVKRMRREGYGRTRRYFPEFMLVFRYITGYEKLKTYSFVDTAQG